MREIKFRGRRLDNGEWVHGNLITPTFDNSNIIFGYYIYEMNKTNYFSRGESELEDFYEMPLVGVYPKTVGQLTGLTDRNGKEIYEGDVVQYEQHLTKKVIISEVYYKEAASASAFGIKNNEPRSNLLCELPVDFEIIGNIYEQPHLIEQNNQ